jgi:hypothetical protein
MRWREDVYAWRVGGSWVACRRCLLVRFFTGDDNDIDDDDDDDDDNVCVCVYVLWFYFDFFCFSLCFLLCNCVDLLSFSVVVIVTVVSCFVFGSVVFVLCRERREWKRLYLSLVVPKDCCDIFQWCRLLMAITITCDVNQQLSLRSEERECVFDLRGGVINKVAVTDKIGIRFCGRLLLSVCWSQHVRLCPR